MEDWKGMLRIDGKTEVWAEDGSGTRKYRKCVFFFLNPEKIKCEFVPPEFAQLSYPTGAPSRGETRIGERGIEVAAKERGNVEETKAGKRWRRGYSEAAEAPQKKDTRIEATTESNI